MGKGGVGKTTIAAAIAAELASRGHSVHLSTTDPAAHIATTLAGQLDNLTMSRIDPIAETKAYVERVMATRGANLDEAGRALLAEDLRSPCYEEVAVFGAFSRIVSAGPVELRRPRHGPDRAHAAAPRRDGLVSPADLATETDAKRPAARLSPRRHAVDAAARSAVHEGLAGDARGDRRPFPRRHGFRTICVARRSSPTPGSSTAAWPPRAQGDPCLKQRIAGELEQIEIVRARHAQRIAIVPWMTEEPVGPERLLALARRGDTDSREGATEQAQSLEG